TGGFTIATNSGGTFGSLPAGTCTSETVAITGIAVNPVADLTDFGASCGTIGEVVYVSILDTQGCNSNAANQPIRTRILAFAFTDGGEGGVTPAGSALLIFSSPLSNSGIALDDDGSLYFHLADLQQFTGGAIFKATELPHNAPGVSSCVPASRVNRTITNIPTVTLTSLTPATNGNGVRVTNFSSAAPNGTGGITTSLTPTFGNVVALASGPHNVIYAALARSFVTT